MQSKTDVHTEHCDYSRCKYGEESSCTVWLGYKEASYPESPKPTEEEFQNRRQTIDYYEW